MSDLKKYIEKRQQCDPEFGRGLESRYSSFKIGVMLAQAREEAGLTLEEMASRLNMDKNTLSRIENNAEEVYISTLERYASALGKKLRVEIR